MSQYNNRLNKNVAPLMHTKPRAPTEELQTAWEMHVSKFPALKHYLRPDYQQNYFDPPINVSFAEALLEMQDTSAPKRLEKIKALLPDEISEYKQLINSLPMQQIHQLREQVYLSRIYGNLGTNEPCLNSRRHWINRVYHDPDPLTPSLFSTLDTATRIRWFETAVQNLTVDTAEEEYLRYKFCLGDNMPLVESSYGINTGQTDYAKTLADVTIFLPTKACKSLLPMMHDAHIYFNNIIKNDCNTHIQHFKKALISDVNLDETLKTYDKLQRCAYGREIRARTMTEPPTFGPIMAIVGRHFPHGIANFIPSMLWRGVQVKSNPLLEYKESDIDGLPRYNNKVVPQIQPLLDELKDELIKEGRWKNDD